MVETISKILFWTAIVIYIVCITAGLSGCEWIFVTGLIINLLLVWFFDAMSYRPYTKKYKEIRRRYNGSKR